MNVLQQVQVITNIKHESELVIEENIDGRVLTSQKKVGGFLIPKRKLRAYPCYSLTANK